MNLSLSGQVRLYDDLAANVEKAASLGIHTILSQSQTQAEENRGKLLI